MITQISTFNFKSHPVRIQSFNDEPYFCLSDVCEVLGVNRRSTEAFRLNEKGCNKITTLTNGGHQEITFINEPNLYRIIFRSNKTEAVEFQNWVFEEVLPQIRKTGKYQITEPAVPVPELAYAQSFSSTDINNLVWLLFSHEQMRFLLEQVYKPLELLDANLSGRIYSNVTEYKLIHKTAKPLIKKLLDNLKSDNPEKWRHLTRYLNNEI